MDSNDLPTQPTGPLPLDVPIPWSPPIGAEPSTSLDPRPWQRYADARHYLAQTWLDSDGVAVLRREAWDASSVAATIRASANAVAHAGTELDHDRTLGGGWNCPGCGKPMVIRPPRVDRAVWLPQQLEDWTDPEFWCADCCEGPDEGPVDPGYLANDPATGLPVGVVQDQAVANAHAAGDHEECEPGDCEVAFDAFYESMERADVADLLRRANAPRPDVYVVVDSDSSGDDDERLWSSQCYPSEAAAQAAIALHAMPGQLLTVGLLTWADADPGFHS